jgi:hypothetical protein
MKALRKTAQGEGHVELSEVPGPEIGQNDVLVYKIPDHASLDHAWWSAQQVKRACVTLSIACERSVKNRVVRGSSYSSACGGVISPSI